MLTFKEVISIIVRHNDTKLFCLLKRRFQSEKMHLCNYTGGGGITTSWNYLALSLLALACQSHWHSVKRFKTYKMSRLVFFKIDRIRNKKTTTILIKSDAEFHLLRQSLSPSTRQLRRSRSAIPTSHIPPAALFFLHPVLTPPPPPPPPVPPLCSATDHTGSPGCVRCIWCLINPPDQSGFTPCHSLHLHLLSLHLTLSHLQIVPLSFYSLSLSMYLSLYHEWSAAKLFYLFAPPIYPPLPLRLAFFFARRGCHQSATINRKSFRNFKGKPTFVSSSGLSIKWGDVSRVWGFGGGGEQWCGGFERTKVLQSNFCCWVSDRHIRLFSLLRARNHQLLFCFVFPPSFFFCPD